MENMGKHEYMESMNVKTFKVLTFMLSLQGVLDLEKRRLSHTWTQQKKEKKQNKTDWPWFFFLRYGKQTYFFYA